MSEEYTVQQGDCIESIAFEHGFAWQTIWNDPENGSLRKAREDTNVLREGDRVFLPDKRSRNEPAATEQRHRFRRRSTPSRLRLRFLDEAKRPRAGVPYNLVVEGRSFSGALDRSGFLEVPIPSNAKRGRLLLGQGDEQEELDLHLGGVDPITEVSGVQGRLNNLGYECGPVDGLLGAATEAALRAFQADQKLQVTGRVDGPTRDKLFELHDNLERG